MIDERLHLHTLGAIDWSGKSGNAPLNEPVCGYLGDKGPCAVAGNAKEIRVCD